MRKVVEVAVIIVMPVALGMLIRAIAPTLSARAEKPIRLLAVVVLILLVIAAVAQSKEVLLAHLGTVGFACLAFNLASLGAGYVAPMSLKLPRAQSIAIAMEIGIHNGTLAIFIALNVLKNSTMSVPAALYSLIMFFTAGAFAFWLNRRQRALPA